MDLNKGLKINILNKIVCNSRISFDSVLNYYYKDNHTKVNP